MRWAIVLVVLLAAGAAMAANPWFWAELDIAQGDVIYGTNPPVVVEGGGGGESGCTLPAELPCELGG